MQFSSALVIFRYRAGAYLMLTAKIEKGEWQIANTAVLRSLIVGLCK